MKEIRKNNKLIISLKDKSLIHGVVYDCTDDRLLVLINQESIQKAQSLKELDEIALRVETHLGNKLMLSTVISELNKYNCIIIENNPEVVVAQKRQSVRVTTDFTFYVRDNKNKPLECKSLNISAGGMAFVSNSEFELDSVINIEFPPNLFGKKINVSARILKASSEFNAVKFLDLNQKDEDKIVKYIFKMMVKK